MLYQPIIDNRDKIINKALEWQKKNYPNRTNNYEKCRRDLTFVLFAYIDDLKNNTSYNTAYIGSKYWIGKTRQIQSYETEIAVHDYIVKYIISDILIDRKTADDLKYLKNMLLRIIKHGPISGIENLFSRRRQIRAAWDQRNIPTKDLVYDILKRTLNVAPSKQNLFPFKIHVFGPENKIERENIGQICNLYKTGSVNHWDDSQKDGNFRSAAGNLNIKDHILDQDGKDMRQAPWVLVFEQRLAESNNFVKEYSALHNLSTTDRFTQVDPDRYRGNTNSKLTCVEVGMFISLLAGICLEHNISVSYIRSFPSWVWKEKEQTYWKDKNKVGLSWDSIPEITEEPLMIVQLGYKADVADYFQSNSVDPNRIHWEDKPNIDTIVKFKE